MAEQHDHTDLDDALVDELREYFARVDPVPDAVLAAAHAAIEFRDLDAQLAELLRDTAEDASALAGVRGGGHRLLTFGLGDVFLEVDAAQAGDEHRELAGYVVPAAAGTLRIQHADLDVEAPLDDEGRFRSARVPRGPVRFHVAIDGRPAFSTPWCAL